MLVLPDRALALTGIVIGWGWHWLGSTAASLLYGLSAGSLVLAMATLLLLAVVWPLLVAGLARLAYRPVVALHGAQAFPACASGCAGWGRRACQTAQRSLPARYRRPNTS